MSSILPNPLYGNFKKCPKCEKVKPLSGFYRDRTDVSGYQDACKDCTYTPQTKRRNRTLASSFLSPDEKYCTRCQQVKDVSEFGIRQENYRDGDAYTSWCKACLAQRRREHYDLEYARKLHRTYAYGLDEETYQLMLFQQGYVCAICGESQNTKLSQELFVDHHHESGQVRQLLCHTCNILVGYVEKDRERVKKVLKYLKKHDR